MSEKIEEYLKIETKTKHLTVPQMITTFRTTGTALQAHRPFWLKGAPSYFEYADQLRVLDDAYRAGNKPKKVERDLVRDSAAFNFQLGGQYVVMRAYELKNPDLLLGTYPLKGAGSRAMTAGVPAYQVEIVLTARNGGTGTAILRGHHVPNGGPYQLQFCKGAPISEDAWSTMPQHYPHCSKIVVPNLDPVSQYFFRIRNNGPMGPGPWSQAVSLIIH